MFHQMTILSFITLSLTANVAAAAPVNSSLCSNLTTPSVPGARVLSITGTEAYNVTSPALPPFFLDIVSNLNVCNVSIYLTHPGVNDKVLVQLFLPLTTWNGRYQATGGGGWATSFGEVQLARGAAANYASSRTDGGHADNFYDPSSWALLPNGSVNVGLLTNFASRSLHDMAVVSKAVIQNFYGKKIAYSYWNGCSTGGREGLAEAQIYPEDFDGIMAAAPTINWPSFLMADQWPQVVMSQEGYFPTQCEFQAFLNATVEQCDILDGVLDGVIADVDGCRFDPDGLVGQKVLCNGTTIVITKKTVDIVRKILQGPTTASGSRLWWGLNAGTDFMGTANTVTANGITRGVPFAVSDAWIRWFLKQDSAYNTSSITYAKFRQLFSQANAEYDQLIGINNPNLAPFKAAGGKMITWQGLADDLVFSEGTVNYYQQVNKVVGDPSDFYRLFLAPGAGHCYSEAGPTPTDALVELAAWVEHGIVPETLAAQLEGPEDTIVTRNICRYPLVAKYDGKGEPSSAASYSCAKSFH